MPNYTDKYKLTKPLSSEMYNIEVFNENMDKVDAAMRDLGDAKVSKDGGELTGYYEFVAPGASRGFKWKTKDGTEFLLRAFFDGDIFQIVRTPSGGTGTSAFAIKSDGSVSVSNPWPISSGGHGATTAAGARENLGVAAKDHGHNLSNDNITGVLAPAKGGTGETTQNGLRKVVNTSELVPGTDVLTLLPGVYQYHNSIDSPTWPTAGGMTGFVEVFGMPITATGDEAVGYKCVRVTDYSGNMYVNVYSNRAWSGWKKATVTSV